MSKKVGDVTYYGNATHLECLTNHYDDVRSRISNGSINSVPLILKDMYRDDLLLFKGLDKITLSIKADLKSLESNDCQRMYAFITVGWNEQMVTPQKMLTVSQNILALKYFKTAYMVLEKHRENGVHHHTHYLVEFEEKIPVSKILGWVYQTKGVKELCLNKNFIDYLGPQNAKKPFQSYEKYFEYINGNKKEDKLKYCLLDAEWRFAFKIEKLYQK